MRLKAVLAIAAMSLSGCPFFMGGGGGPTETVNACKVDFDIAAVTGGLTVELGQRENNPVLRHGVRPGAHSSGN